MTGGSNPSDEAVLDNLAWHALTGPQADLAEPTVEPAVRRFRRSIAPFSAVDRLDDSDWSALARVVGPGGAAILFRAEVGIPPDGWEKAFEAATVQYVAGDLAEPDPAVTGELTELGPADRDDMVALVVRTEPGPFSAETWRTGRYLGLRRRGELVAMAGERLRAPGWGEVSAVCVHPSVRGRGVGAALTSAVSALIAARGDRPMLHVAEGNEPAHRLYRQLGFEARREVVAGAYRNVGS